MCCFFELLDLVFQDFVLLFEELVLSLEVIFFFGNFLEVVLQPVGCSLVH